MSQVMSNSYRELRSLCVTSAPSSTSALYITDGDTTNSGDITNSGDPTNSGDTTNARFLGGKEILKEKSQHITHILALASP